MWKGLLLLVVIAVVTESHEQSGGPGSLSVTITWSAYVGTAGSHIIIECKILSLRSEIIDSHWIFENSTIRVVIPFRSTDGKYITGDNLNPFIQIRNLSKSDEGQYTCRATNSFGTSYSSQTLLSVNDDIPFVSVDSILYIEFEGNDIVLVCHVDPLGSPVIFVSWEVVLNDNGSVSTRIPSHDEDDKYEGATNLNPSLKIKKISIGDSGFYKCSAGNVFGNGSSNYTELKVLGNLPDVTILHTEYSGNVGTDIVLHCMANSPYSQLISTNWMLINESDVQRIIIPSTSGPNNKYVIGDIYNPFLLIKNLTIHDHGLYKCSASNEYGTGFSNSTLLIVTGNAPYVFMPKQQYTGHVGTDIVIPCVIESPDSSLYTIHWTYSIENHTTTIQHDSATNISSKYEVGDVFNHSLIIYNLTQHDAGYYQCFALNGFGTGTSNYTFLTITGNPPYVTIPQQQYTGHVGTDIVIPCVIESPDSSLYTIHWTYSIENHPTTIQHDSATNISSKYKVGDVHDVSNHSLIINNLTQHDEGYYKCFSSNVFGTGMSNYTFLTITGNPPYVNIPQKQYTGHVGTDTLIPCTIESPDSSQNTIHWTHSIENNTTTIQHDSATNISSKYKVGEVFNHSLIIYNLTQHDVGYYQCFSSNVFGTGMSNYTFLKITGDYPLVIVPQLEYTRIVGTDIVMQCGIKSPDSSLISYRWGYSIDNHSTTIDLSMDDFNYKLGDIFNPTLLIHNLTKRDAGFYECSGSNAFGTSRSNRIMLIIKDPPSVAISSQYYTAIFGQPVTLSCEISSSTTVNDVFWERNLNGEITKISSRLTGIDGVTIDNPALTINVTTLSDSGLYTCYAENEDGIGKSNVTQLHVIGGLPNITTKSTTVTATYGDGIMLPISIDAVPKLLYVYWTKFRNGSLETIHSGATGTQYGDIDHPSLLITFPTVSDVGIYNCYAVNVLGVRRSENISLSVEGGIPIVKVESEEYIAQYGDKVTLGCNVISYPDHTTVYWEKQVGNTITKLDSTTRGINGSTIDSPSLTIILVTSTDSGSYSCKAENAVGVGSSRKVLLKVDAGTPIVNIGAVMYTTVFGIPITLECQVYGHPTIRNIFWQKNVNGFITTISLGAVGIQGLTPNVPNLTITFPTQSDEGEYSCFAMNDLGQRGSLPTLLKVLGDVPELSTDVDYHKAVFGHSYTINCKVDATPFHKHVYWEHRTKGLTRKLKNDTVGVSGVSLENPSLTISFVTTSDSGSYTCFAENIIGTGFSRTVQLEVKGDIPAVDVTLTSISAIHGEDLSLVCSVISFPLHTNVYWKKETTEGYSILSYGTTGTIGIAVESPSLTLKPAIISDSGTYTCVASNMVGTGVSRSITVLVHPRTEDEEDVSAADGIFIDMLIKVLTPVLSFVFITILGIIVTCVKVSGCCKPKPVISLQTVHESADIMNVILKCKNNSCIPMTKVKIYVKKNNTSGKEKLEIISKKETDDDGSHIFELKDVKESDDVEYSCKVKNKFRIKGKSDSVTLKSKDHKSRNPDTTSSVTMSGQSDKKRTEQDLAIWCATND